MVLDWFSVQDIIYIYTTSSNVRQYSNEQFRFSGQQRSPPEGVRHNCMSFVKIEAWGLSHFGG